MRLRRVLALAPLLCFAACSDDSYAVVSVLTRSGSVDGVAQFRVYVENGSAQDTLLYPKQRSESLHLDTGQPVTFSVEFTSSRAGQATFEVEPIDRDGNVLGYGKATAAVAKDAVVNVPVRVELGAIRPERGLDGGTAGDGGNNQLSCDPYAPASACGANQTCGLLCSSPPTQPAVGMCYGAGSGKPGDVCARNGDCAPGSQCFAFGAKTTGCSVMTCLRFCDHDDAMCGEQDAYCNVPIECGTTPHFEACSRPCDPTGTGTIGCATGLACFVYAGESTDCACAGLGNVGAACTQNSGCDSAIACAGCQAGLSCIVPAGSTTGTSSGACRPICILASPTCPTGTTCHAFAASTRLVYGFCQ
jgi:hypothetical protein